jgi:hypothetical protein
MEKKFCSVCYSVWPNGRPTCRHHDATPISREELAECLESYREGQGMALRAIMRTGESKTERRKK